ncbi:MAG: hypothetical protein ACE5I1_10830, partial [bacterium]
ATETPFYSSGQFLGCFLSVIFHSISCVIILLIRWQVFQQMSYYFQYSPMGELKLRHEIM